MADKGRDLKVSVLSDADQFDLGKPADDLDRLGDAARGAGQELSQLDGPADQLRSIGQDADSAADDVQQLGDDARRAARDVDDLGDKGKGLDKLGDHADKAGKDTKALGDDADKAARQVDGAFDKIAASSKRSAKSVDDSMDKAGEGLDEFKDEAAGTSREAAASFTGSFDDVASTVQEVAANAFAGFGPLGMAAGIAAAAGIGFLVSSVTEAKERVKELASGLLELRLDPEMDNGAERVRQVLDTLKDDGDLTRFRDAARAAGIDWSTYVRALANGGPAADEVRAKLQPLIDSLGGASAMFTEAGGGANDLMNRLNDQGAAADQASGSAAAYTEALEGLQVADDSSVAIQGLTDALASFTDPAGVYTDLLADAEQAERDRAQATADATKSSKDSWEDYAKSVDVSVDDYLASLQRQVEAQEGWATNLQALARRGVSEGVLAELEKMGPQGAPLVAKLTKASDAELGKLVTLMRRKGADSSEQLAAGIAAGKPGIRGQVSEIREDMRSRLSGRINVPVGVDGPSAGEIAAVRRGIANGLSGIQVGVTAIAKTVVSRSVP